MDVSTSDQTLFGEGWVMHARPADASRLKNKFQYPVFNLLVPVHSEQALNKLTQSTFMSLSPCDYLDGRGGSLREKIEDFLGSELNYSCEQIWLQTLPRIFGYVFNPVSFWFCYKGGNLDAVLCEVNNTFGDRHYYFIKNVRQDGSAMHSLPKSFHVSPFFAVTGHYTFKFKKDSEKSDVTIQLFDDDKLKLDTSIRLKFRPLKDFSTLYILRKYGWITVMVILKIHYQAIKLWSKGAAFFRRPPLAKERLTYDRSDHQH